MENVKDTNVDGGLSPEGVDDSIFVDAHPDEAWRAYVRNRLSAILDHTFGSSVGDEVVVAASIKRRPDDEPLRCGVMVLLGEDAGAAGAIWGLFAGSNPEAVVEIIEGDEGE